MRRFHHSMCNKINIDVMLFLVIIVFGSLNNVSDGCEVGFYGKSCSDICPNVCHDKECNVTSGKCLSCMKGYYSNYEKDCILCPAHCVACNSNNFCFACKTGYRGEVCEYNCTNCKPDTSCDKNTGYCFENCSEGRSGELCNIECDSKCKSCNRHNEHVCLSCADGENGKVCKEECFNQCLTSTCKESHESCTYECSSGSRADKTCNQTCLSYCKNRVCDITCKEMIKPDRPSSSTSKANVGLSVGLVIGSIVIICVCSIGFILVRRRITKRRHNKKSTPATNDEENIELLSQEARRTHETREFPSAEKLTVLQESFSVIEAKYGNMKITVAGNNVTIEGVREDIEEAFKEINIKCDEIKHAVYKHSKSKAWLSFCQKRQTVEYVQHKLKQKQLLGIWGIDDEELKVFLFGTGSCENFRNIVLESVSEISEPVDKSLFSSEWWGEFLLYIRRIFQDKVDIFTKEQQNVVIICTDDVVKQVTKMASDFSEGITDTISLETGVCEFVSKYWTDDDFDDIRKNGVMIKTEVTGFKIRGLLNNVTKCKADLNRKVNGISSEQHVLNKTGLSTVLEAIKHTRAISDIETECRCVIKLPQEIDESPSMMLCDHEVINSDIRENQDSNTDTSPKCFQTRRNKIKVQLIQEDICRQTADIIVVEAASNLDLRSVSAFTSVFKQGGSRLQTDFKSIYPNGIQDGEVAVIDSGEFNCDKIYLTSLPPWKEASCNGLKVLRNFMRESLRLAEKNAKSVIAFSSLVTGVFLGYPIDMAISIMYGAVVEFDTSYSKTSLKGINFVTDKEDDHIFKAFKDHEYKRIYGASSVGSLSTGFVGGRIKIELVTGDLSTQEVDAILCGLSEDMNLNNNAIFKSLIQNGGESLQDECKTKFGLKLEVGKIVDISAGNLPCKTVFLALLSTNIENSSVEQSLITTLQAVFDLANSKSYKSLAIAAIENGYLSYPEKTVANCMYEAVIEWVSKEQNASLKVVRIVMYSKDRETHQTYRMCHLKAKGRETRKKRTFFEDGTNMIKPEEDSKYKMITDGCAIGRIQLQVQVGDILKTTADAIFIGDDVNTGKKVGVRRRSLTTFKEKSPNEDGVMITGNDKFETRYMFHVQYQVSLAGWRDELVECLKEADKKSFKSVAFPVLKTGDGRIFRADGIGDCFFAAIDDCTSQNQMTSVTDVRLVVPDSNAGCIPAIIAALQARITAVKFHSGIGKIYKSQLGESNKFTEFTVTIYSDEKLNLDRCYKALDDRIGLEFAKKVVDVDRDVISKMKDNQINNIIDSDLIVDVDFNQKRGQCTIFGPLRNVLAAVPRLHTNMQQYKQKENNRKSAQALYDQTKWCWLCESHMTSEEVPYDMMTNFNIETAYKDRKQTLELQSKDGKIYVIDFQKLVEYPKVNINDIVTLIRKDILKPKDEKISKTDKFFMTMRSIIGGSEYQEVKKRFLEEVTNGIYSNTLKNSQSVEVVKIESIKNKTLWKQYKAKKKLMEQQKPGYKQIERRLWHETAVESIPRIINTGFNRNNFRIHGVLFGEGVYFAADASYASKSYLDEIKPGAKRHMFLAKVLTGDIVNGKPGMRVLPPIDPVQPSLLYDSAVDDINNPMDFVIFHENQAYPEYLITYTSK